MSIGLQHIEGYSPTVGVGYIVIPTDIDRASYINYCYSNNRVSIKCEDGSYYNRVPIDKTTINLIEFPFEATDLGTGVVFVTEPTRNLPIIIAALAKNDEVKNLSEGQFKLRRKFGDKVIEIFGDEKTGNLTLNVSGYDNGSISILNNSINGFLDVLIKGNINIRSKKELNIEAENGVKISSTQDSTEEDTKQSILQIYDNTTTLDTEKFVINDGDEPMVRGNKLKEFLNDFITEVSSIKVTTAIGLQPIVNATQVELLKKKLDQFLSEDSYIK